eukprot:6487642-Amphidinium_carterae.2
MRHFEVWLSNEWLQTKRCETETSDSSLVSPPGPIPQSVLMFSPGSLAACALHVPDDGQRGSKWELPDPDSSRPGSLAVVRVSLE